MRSKRWPFLFALGLSLLVTGFSCAKLGSENGKTNGAGGNSGQATSTTGSVGEKAIDLSDKNGGEIIVKVGDILVVDLVGDLKENQTKYYQWNIRPIPSSVPEIISLLNHTNTTESPKAKEGEWVSHWEFKVEKAGEFTLKFAYQGLNLQVKPKKTFEIKITSIE